MGLECECTYGQTYLILVFITYAQNTPIKAHADVSFIVNLVRVFQLHPFCVYASSECSEDYGQTRTSTDDRCQIMQ